MPDPNKPILLFVHGSWHSQAHFQPLFDNLSASGYECACVSLPSRAPGKDWPALSFTDDTLAVRANVESQLAFNDVVVIAHSYGGAPTMNALEDLEKPRQRAHVGRETRVLAVGLMCAALLPVGQTFLGFLGGKPLPIHQSEGEFYKVGPPGPEYHFYNDLPAEEAKHWASLLQLQSSKAYEGEVEYDASLDFDVSYLLCKKDQALSYQLQLGLIKQAKARGARNIRTQEIDASHSPFLSQIEATAVFLRETAGEKGLEM